MNDVEEITETLISTINEQMNALTTDMKAHDRRMNSLRDMLDYQDHLQAPKDELNGLQKMLITSTRTKHSLMRDVIQTIRSARVAINQDNEVLHKKLSQYS